VKRWVVGVLLGAATGGALVKRLWLEKYHRLKGELECSEREREMLHQWLRMEQQGYSLKEYFAEHDYQRVAIFGMGRIGRRLADALGDKAAYGVEQDHLGAVHERLTVYRLGDDPLPPADCMVVCDLERAAEKQAAAQKEFPNEIVRLPDVLTWLFEQHSEELSGTVPLV